MTSSANHLYHTSEGVARLRLSIAGFIDVLGFSQMSIAETSLDQQQRLLERITHSIEDSRRFVREEMSATNPAMANSLAIKYFSDNLVLGCPLEADANAGAAVAFVLRCVQMYQLRISLNGFFVRGALTQGQLCVTDDIIFGSALVESYQLESKTAIVPRIIVTEPLERLLRERLQTRNEATSDRELICRDIDGWWFVNYLQAARTASGVCWDSIARHKQNILLSMSGTKRHDVLPKYGWACRYHNVFCHWRRNEPGYREEYRIDRADEHSTIDRIAPTD